MMPAMDEPGGGAQPAKRDAASSTDEPRTRGFLFCDLRGYTSFVEAHGDRAAADLLDRYRAIVRTAVERAHGAEIRTEGDSFYVVFPSASPAVRCGLDIVAAAAAASLETPDRPFRVGVGIHAGESVEQAEGYIGSAVNIAARVCAQAEPGEVLVTDTVRSLVRTTLGVTFTPRGRPRLKGISEPISLFRVSSGAEVSPRTGSKHPGPALAGVAVAAVVVLVVGAALIARPWAAGGATPSSTPTSSASASVAGTAPGSPVASASDLPSSPPSGSTAALTGRLAFIASQQVGNVYYPRHQLYVVEAAGADRKRMTVLTDQPSRAAWSPDGRALIYSRSDFPPGPPRIVTVNKAPATSDWPGPWQVEGTIAWDGQTYYAIEEFAWSPSGELLIAAIRRTTPDVARIFAFTADGSSVRVVTEPDPGVQPGSIIDRSPAPTRDGRTVAFSSVEWTGTNRSAWRGASIWAAALDGTGRIQITSGMDAASPAWSPDGNRITFSGSATQGGPIEIWVVDAQGTNLQRLTNDDASDRSPVWSPDGQWIAWTRTVSGQRQIWVMAADGSGARPLLVGDTGEQLDLQGWAPDPG